MMDHHSTLVMYNDVMIDTIHVTGRFGIINPLKYKLTKMMQTHVRQKSLQHSVFKIFDGMAQSEKNKIIKVHWMRCLKLPQINGFSCFVPQQDSRTLIFNHF